MGEPHEDFEKGPRINENLVLWLDKQAAGRKLQLPVEIHCGPLGIESCYLRENNTKIEIELDTGALSIDLPMHLKPYCNAYPCKVWLEGTWGALISVSSQEALPVFSVRRVIGNADEQEMNIRISKE